MKKAIYIFLVVSLVGTHTMNSQVAINKDGSTPATGSILHVKGDNAGTPVESMFIESTTGNIGIGTISPVTSLHLFSPSDNNGLTLQTSDNTYNNGIRFQNSGSAYTWRIYRKESTTNNHADLMFANGASSDITTLTDVVVFRDGGGVGIGTTSPDASASLEISSTSSGFLPPRLTTTQRDAIASPAEGLTIYNTDISDMEFYNGTTWRGFYVPNSEHVTCGDQFVDSRDGKVYGTLLIGSQCWMLENLNVGTFIEDSKNQTDNDTIEKYCFNNNTAKCDNYGGMYKWNEMMQFVTTEGGQGICPDGWHIPTSTEWTTLTNTQGGLTVAGGKLKETGTAHWASPNTGATNESGFTAFGGGYRYGGTFYYIKSLGRWWTSTEWSFDDSHAVTREMAYNNDNVTDSHMVKGSAVYVRCIKD